MREHTSPGRIGRLAVSAAPSAAAGFFLLLAVFSFAGRRLFGLRPGAALVGGLGATALHFLSELWHQLGHARAAERTGYPMSGVRFWGVLATSLYPADEPELPAEHHVERALGGPRASALFVLLGALMTVVTRPLGGLAYMISVLFTLDNLLIFTLGAFLPLPFMETDGTTIRRYRRAHRKRMVIVQE